MVRADFAAKAEETLEDERGQTRHRRPWAGGEIMSKRAQSPSRENSWMETRPAKTPPRPGSRSAPWCPGRVRQAKSEVPFETGVEGLNIMADVAADIMPSPRCQKLLRAAGSSSRRGSLRE